MSIFRFDQKQHARIPVTLHVIRQLVSLGCVVVCCCRLQLANESDGKFILPDLFHVGMGWPPDAARLALEVGFKLQALSDLLI